MTECTPSHCHHHSLSAHLLLKGWNVSGASSWWGITLQRGATPLWYVPPFNTCTPHSKKNRDTCAGYLSFSGAQETHTTEEVTGWLLSRPSTLLRICQSIKNGYVAFDAKIHPQNSLLCELCSSCPLKNWTPLGPRSSTSSLYRLWRNLTCQHYMHPRDFAFPSRSGEVHWLHIKMDRVTVTSHWFGNTRPEAESLFSFLSSVSDSDGF